MKELDFLPQYTDAVKASTDRTRYIFLVLIAASILMYAAFWNSRSTGWAGARLALARATERILSHEETLKKDPLLGDLQIPRGQEDLYAIARENAARSGMTLYQAQQNLNQLQQVRGEQVNHIQVPVPGIGAVNFDINDLAMFGGFTILVLLIWETYSLWHYADNLRLTFDLARDIGAKQLDDEGQNRILYHTYQTLTMHQVLTIPPRPASKASDIGQLKLFLRKAPRLMYVLPLAVQTTVVLVDWETFNLGSSVSRSATVAVLVYGTTIWLLVIVLTVLCLYVLRKTDITWRRGAETI
jgi:hypothetical protein